MLVVSTGVPGVGATTVTGRAIEEADGWTEENYGDVMFEVAEEEGLVESRDGIRKLDPDTQKRIQKMASRTLASRAEENDIIVDTHCTINTPSGYLPGLPEWVLEELKPDTIVLVEANPAEIKARREDDSRDRDVQPQDEIQEHQEMNRMAAMSYAALTGATVKLVSNHDDGLEEAVADFGKVL